jgi:hypothetical protein
MFECYSLMNTKDKDNIEKAISIQMEILNSEKEYIPAIYVMIS